MSQQYSNYLNYTQIGGGGSFPFLPSCLPHREQVWENHQIWSCHSSVTGSVTGFAGTQHWNLLCRKEATAPTRVLNTIKGHGLCRLYTAKWSFNETFYKWDFRSQKGVATSFQSTCLFGKGCCFCGKVHVLYPVRAQIWWQGIWGNVLFLGYFVWLSVLWHLVSLPLISSFACTKQTASWSYFYFIHCDMLSYQMINMLSYQKVFVGQQTDFAFKSL